MFVLKCDGKEVKLKRQSSILVQQTVPSILLCRHVKHTQMAQSVVFRLMTGVWEVIEQKRCITQVLFTDDYT